MKIYSPGNGGCLLLYTVFAFLAVSSAAEKLTAQNAPDQTGEPVIFTPEIPISLEEQYPSYSEILFSNENSPDGFITYRELAVWANARNLGVVADCPIRDLQNHIAAVIPRTGFRFHLKVPEKKRMYLYLDLVSFRPLSNFQKGSEESYCLPSYSSSPFTTREKTYDLPQIHFLEVRFGGRKTARIHMGGGVFPVTPVVLPVDREHYSDGILKVELRPSGSGAFFAIWDVSLSSVPPER